MTELEQAKIATDLLNALSPMFIFVFITGAVCGVFFFGRVVESLDRLSVRFRKPKRIKFRNLNGRHERKDNFEYLYLFESEYYTLEQRNFLIEERKNEIKTFSKLNFFNVFLVALVVFLFIYLVLSSIVKILGF